MRNDPREDRPRRRFPPLPADSMTSEQRRAHGVIVAARGRSGGPYDALLRLPDLALQVLRLGDAVRFGNHVEPRLMELAIVTTAQHWGAEFA
jgi:4-carboxymuconolactone decarboxylase